MASRSGCKTTGGPPPRRPRWTAVAGRIRTATGVGGLLLLAGCQTGIGPDPNRPRATIEAYETRVGGLERQLEEQRATFQALTPPPGTPTPEPFATRWQVEIIGETELRSAVGRQDGLTPVAADGLFLVVPIRVTNLTPEPASFNPVGAIEVVDGDGRRFEVDPRASDATYLLDLGLDPSFAPRQPGIPFDDVLVFDVPEGAEGFVLESVGGGLSLPLEPRPAATPAG
ncbi:MAG: DUF4352 domain-containing protein [Chloroflexota bacterium]|nr:DUF4352 domain-containing protein [Chloroflexota bacterium]